MLIDKSAGISRGNLAGFAAEAVFGDQISQQLKYLRYALYLNTFN